MNFFNPSHSIPFSIPQGIIFNETTPRLGPFIAQRFLYKKAINILATNTIDAMDSLAVIEAALPPQAHPTACKPS
jgi:hypothetical protein